MLYCPGNFLIKCRFFFCLESFALFLLFAQLSARIFCIILKLCFLYIIISYLLRWCFISRVHFRNGSAFFFLDFSAFAFFAFRRLSWDLHFRSGGIPSLGLFAFALLFAACCFGSLSLLIVFFLAAGVHWYLRIAALAPSFSVLRYDILCLIRNLWRHLLSTAGVASLADFFLVWGRFWNFIHPFWCRSFSARW